MDEKILNDNGCEALIGMVEYFWTSILRTDEDLIRVECEEDRKAITLSMYVTDKAALGAFLGAGTANMQMMMRFLRVQQIKPHNRYLIINIYKAEKGKSTFLPPQVFVDKSVFLKDGR
jgi:hypothetical protein